MSFLSRSYFSLFCNPPFDSRVHDLRASQLAIHAAAPTLQHKSNGNTMGRTTPLFSGTASFHPKGLGSRERRHYRFLIWVRNAFILAAGIGMYTISQNLVEQQTLYVPYHTPSGSRMVLEGNVVSTSSNHEAQTAAICAIQKDEDKYWDEWVR